MNNGQLIKILRDKFSLNAIPFNKIKGTPFMRRELREKFQDLLNKK